MSVESIGKVAFDVIYEDNVEIVYKVAAKYWEIITLRKRLHKVFS